MLSIAFKEWAVVCRSLAEGSQSLILRKGGIAEADGEFRPEHEQFFLYPTYFHEQQHAGIKLELLPLLERAEAERPPAGIVRISHYAEVQSVTRLTDLEQALALDAFHCWTADTVRQRFQYRSPGLFVLVVRVFRLPHVHDIEDRPEYAGCKSWVPLHDGIPTDGSTPVLEDTRFANVVQSIANYTARS